MRTYGQYCAMARALDVIGDRWTLLIVRELWVRPHRFGTLAEALPGVATNLLTDRLRALENAGVVDRAPGPPLQYRLTERGSALAPVMRELIRWGAAEMVREPGEDRFRNAWFGQALEALVPGAAVRQRLTFALHFDGGGPPAILRADPELGVRLERPDDAARPEAVIIGDPQALVTLLTHGTDLSDGAELDAVTVAGSATGVRRVRALLGAAAYHLDR